MSADRFRQAAKANDSGSWNKYSYTRNDPVNRADRRGTCDTETEKAVLGDSDCDDCDPFEDEFCPVGGGGDPGGGGDSGYWVNLGSHDLGLFGSERPQRCEQHPRLSYGSAIGQGVPASAFDQGADFTAIRNTGTGATFLVYNQSNFWQTNRSQIAGTLLHEITHLSSNANYAPGDVAIATMIGVQNQLKYNADGSLADDSAISTKLATDCFKGLK